MIYMDLLMIYLFQTYARVAIVPCLHIRAVCGSTHEDLYPGQESADQATSVLFVQT